MHNLTAHEVLRWLIYLGAVDAFLLAVFVIPLGVIALVKYLAAA